jgi:hypothetical protein
MRKLFITGVGCVLLLIAYSALYGKPVNKTQQAKLFIKNPTGSFVSTSMFLNTSRMNTFFLADTHYKTNTLVLLQSYQYAPIRAVLSQRPP